VADRKPTPDERLHWQKQGYLLLPGALAAREVAEILGAVDGLLAEEEAAALRPQGGTGQAGKLDRAVERTAALDGLLDHPAVFGKIVAFLGPYLQVLGSEIFVRRPGPGTEPLLAWHTDGGPALAGFSTVPEGPVLQLKAQFFLTDTAEPDGGNFLFVPGSHRRRFPQKSPTSPRGAVQLLARPGDVLLFPWSLWHAVAPNRSGRVRKSVTLRYGPLWARPYDYERLPAAVLERLSPRRRRLFGDLGPERQPWEHYYPDPAEWP